MIGQTIMKSMNEPNHAIVLSLLLSFAGLNCGCSSGAQAIVGLSPESNLSPPRSHLLEPAPLGLTSLPPEPNTPRYIAQVACWDTVSCCVQRNPLTAVQSCGADPAKVASILKTFESLYAATHPGAKAAQETDVAEAGQKEDWTSIAELPAWKQLCIKTYYACKDRGWTGKCDDCLRYCEGQQEWPTSMCRPRKKQ